MYGVALCRPRQFHVAMETVDGLSTCDCGRCECRVDGRPGDLLLSPDFNQVGVTVGGEQSSVQTFLEDFNFQGFDIDPDHG